MKIDKKETLAGLPIMKIRGFLKTMSSYDVWGIEYVEYRLLLEKSEAEHVVSELMRIGYIEEVTEMEDTYYMNTLEGNSFAMASAAPSLHRATADTRLREFLDRVEEVRDNSHYIFKVRKVLVFGSYLDKERKRINDIDLAVELIRKESDLDKHNELRKQRIDRARKDGRRFKNIVEELSWPEIEVWKYLKSRKRCLSIHSIHDEILKFTHYEIIYEDL